MGVVNVSISLMQQMHMWMVCATFYKTSTGTWLRKHAKCLRQSTCCHYVSPCVIILVGSWNTASSSLQTLQHAHKPVAAGRDPAGANRLELPLNPRDASGLNLHVAAQSHGFTQYCGYAVSNLTSQSQSRLLTPAMQPACCVVQLSLPCYHSHISPHVNLVLAEVIFDVFPINLHINICLNRMRC